MTSYLVLSPISDDAGTQGRRRGYRVMQASTPLGTISRTDQDLVCEWCLPVWSIRADRSVWDGLQAALISTQRAEHITVARAWSAVEDAARSGRLPGDGGATFGWLRATSRTRTAPPYFAQRYPAASDAVALAQLAHESQADSVVGCEAMLAATFDATFALFANSWGTLLEACSVVIEAGRSVTGTALTTLYGDTPLIALLAARSPLVARTLLVTVLDALADLHYLRVNLLLRATSSEISVAGTLGFEQLGLVRQTLLYS